jgi:hypothetical protein
VKIKDLFEDSEKKEDSLHSVIKDEEFSTDSSFEKKNGKRYKVVEYSKELTIEPYNIVLKYKVNPETESWNYVVINADNGKAVDMTSGEDTSSLIKSIKKKKKILPSWIEKYLSDN